MAAGYFCGKTYPRIQVFAVFLLSIGVSLAAWSDSKDKVIEQSLYSLLVLTGQIENERR